MSEEEEYKEADMDVLDILEHLTKYYRNRLVDLDLEAKRVLYENLSDLYL